MPVITIAVPLLWDLRTRERKPVSEWDTWQVAYPSGQLARVWGGQLKGRSLGHPLLVYGASVAHQIGR